MATNPHKLYDELFEKFLTCNLLTIASFTIGVLFSSNLSISGLSTVFASIVKADWIQAISTSSRNIGHATHVL